MIDGLKIHGTLVVFSQPENVGFHGRFIARVIQLEGAAVIADKAHLGGQPEITVPVKQQVIDTILGQSIVVGKMLDRIAVDETG